MKMKWFDECRSAVRMLWWIRRKLHGKTITLALRKKMVSCACEIARLVLVYVPNGEKIPLATIKTTEAWTRGEASGRAVYKAANDAYDAAACSVDDAAAYAADAAAAAAMAHILHAGGAAGAAGAACAGASAAGGARKDMQQQCADIVRKHFTMEDLK